jgi:hypothetical protein
MLMTVELAWLEVLVAARRFDSAPLALRPGILLAVATRVRKLEGLAKSNPGSFETHFLLARAEMLRITRRPAKARELADRAVRSAVVFGSPKREGVALDLASRYARAEGDGTAAGALRSRAEDAYRRWGAVGLLERRTGVGRTGADSGGVVTRGSPGDVAV